MTAVLYGMTFQDNFLARFAAKKQGGRSGVDLGSHKAACQARQSRVWAARGYPQAREESEEARRNDRTQDRDLQNHERSEMRPLPQAEGSEKEEHEEQEDIRGRRPLFL